MGAGALQDGDANFARWMDSVSDPLSLPAGSFVFSENMLNRGGALQTRPGYRWRFTLPSGKLQGLTTFVPRVGKPVLVAFVDGVPYLSQFPYTSYTAAKGARMSANAKQIFASMCVQSVERNADGSLRFISPRRLLMCQDGLSPATYFDGSKFVALTGSKVTPQGTHMAWAGSRLWVARREQLFASDIANPLAFEEQEYNTLGGISYFLLPGHCTGLAALPGAASSIKSPLLAFTNSTTSLFRANILSRDLWPQVDDFQAVILPDVGCVAPRSLTAASGMLWWFSQFGQTRLDAAQASQISSRLQFIDREMVRSSATLSGNLSGICATTFENFILTSVPHASLANTHTWVFDSSIQEAATASQPAAWSSVWTGVSPVEWTRLEAGGRVRLFCGSVDGDGGNRVYEAFQSDRRDNGCDIPWAFETRAYTGGALTPKEFRFLEFGLSELSGQVDLRFGWAGASRGRFKTFATRSYKAEEGSLDATKVLESDTPVYALKRQSRVDRTNDVLNAPEDSLSSAGREGPSYVVEADKEQKDTAFQFRVEGSGPCAVRFLRVFMDVCPEPDTGAPDDAEEGLSFVRFDGSAAGSEEALRAAPETFTANASASAKWNNYVASASASATGTISQSDADKRAEQAAQARAEAKLAATAAPYKREVVS